MTVITGERKRENGGGGRKTRRRKKAASVASVDGMYSFFQ